MNVNLRHIIALLLLNFSFVLSGCNDPRSGSVRISDVSKTNTFVLTTSVTEIWGIEIHIHGQIDGTAYVFADNWETNKLSGSVDWRIDRDWFKTNCLLHYNPESVKSGALIVDYTFH